MAFNFAQRDPQKTLDVTNAATMGHKYCNVAGRVAVCTKLHVTGLTSGATVYLTVVRIIAGSASEDLVYLTIPAYRSSAVAGCFNAEVNV